MADLNEKLSWGLVNLGYNVPDNYACANQATHADIVETWKHSDSVPSEKAILDAYDLWLIEQEKIKYRKDRKAEYPALAEQLDEIYHNGIDSWKAVIKVTKDKYPKG